MVTWNELCAHALQRSWAGLELSSGDGCLPSQRKVFSMSRCDDPALPCSQLLQLALKWQRRHHIGMDQAPNALHIEEAHMKGAGSIALQPSLYMR